MKVAINHYGSFEAPSLDLYLQNGDSFIVTPKIEGSKQFQTGLARKKFEIVDVDDLSVVQRAVNITPVILETFRERLTATTEPEEEPEPEKATEETKPETPPAEEEKKAESEPTPEPEKTEEPAKEDEKADEEGELDDVLPFTEEAGNQDKAVEAINKETDIKKLKHAQEHDSRKKVQAALEARIKELES